jgi:hypothetical protein
VIANAESPVIMLRMTCSSFHSKDRRKRGAGRMVPKPRRRRGVGRDAEIVPFPEQVGMLICCIVWRSQNHFWGYAQMRLLLALIVIIYLVGVGVVLSPTVRSTWNSEPASVLADRIVQALPEALAWPVRAAHVFVGS